MISLLGNPAWKSLGRPDFDATGSMTGAIQTVIGKRQGGTDGFDLLSVPSTAACGGARILSAPCWRPVFTRARGILGLP